MNITIDFQNEQGHSLGFVRVRENGHTVAIAEGFRIVFAEEGRPTETHTYEPSMGEVWGDPDPNKVVDRLMAFADKICEPEFIEQLSRTEPEKQE